MKIEPVQDLMYELNKNSQWRFIDTGFNAGEYNMAVDEALLDEFCAVNTLPVFRLYGWNPPAISLGRFQNMDEVLNVEECRQDKISVVRRITGGGAIFHSDELTYSLVCSRDAVNSLSVKSSYKKLSYFLILAYRALGLDAYYANEFSTYTDGLNSKCGLGKKTDFCFGGREEYDVLIAGKKMGGNAQRRKKNIIFQHGSIPISLNLMNIKKYFKTTLYEVEANSTCLESLTDVNIAEFKAIIKQSFRENMGITFIKSGLTMKEKKATRKLRVEKYMGKEKAVAEL